MSYLPRNFWQHFVDNAEETAYSIEKDMQGLLESPIETTLAVAFHMSLRLLGHPTTNVQNYAMRPSKVRSVWVLAPQQTIQTYRVDMILGWWLDDEFECVAVECDGHAYHERTKEQASHDRRKDRDLQTVFKRVMRFTGSDIHRNAFECATEIQQAIIDLHRKEPRS